MDEMDVEEWFAKRERLAERFGVTPRQVSPEMVWFLKEDQTLTEAEIRRAQEIYAHLTSTGVLPADQHGYQEKHQSG